MPVSALIQRLRLKPASKASTAMFHQQISAQNVPLDSRVQKQRRDVKCGKPIFFLTFSFNSSLQNFPLIFYFSSSFFLSSSQHHTVARESSIPSPALRAPSAKLDSSKIKTPTPVSRANSVQLDGVPFLMKINNK